MSARQLTATHVHQVPSPWLRGRLNDLAGRLAFGAGPRCEHLRDGTGTATVAALWSDTVVCARCAPRLRLHDHDADRTCDRCGVLSLPTIHPAVIEAGPRLLVAFGLCQPCRDAEVGR